MRIRTDILLAAFLAASCSQPRAGGNTSAPKVDGAAIKAHIQRLASDEFEGRGPASKGEEITTAYISDFFKSIGLKTQFQSAPFVGITSTVLPVQLNTKAGKKTLKYGDDFMAWSRHEEPVIKVDGDLVFCGYGAVAPEFQWNDFKDSVKGKIIVVLINDPQLEDQSKFGGKAMTYYGRWTYKFEEAQRQGAAGALIVHETDMASYPWEVVRGSWSGEQFDIATPDKGASTVPLKGWITRDVAADLFKSAGFDFADMKKRALQQDFKPIPLGIKGSVEIRNKVRTTDSKNVIGVLEGSEKPEEVVIYTAHWDHFGIGEPQNGDKIFHGAVDNASGVASILEIARAAAMLQPRPKRSLVFMAITGEEQGLLGSAYYASNPIFPLNKTLADINVDEANVFGRNNNQIEVVGSGYTTLEDILAEIVAKQGRKVVPDSSPEAGHYFRSDQFSFVKQGIPSLFTTSITPEDEKDFTANRYHKPADKYDPNWDMKAAVADNEALLELGLRVANGDKWPEWKPGAGFKRPN
jgi:Zn-dependent M28 family amino/carboxypeptidase